MHHSNSSRWRHEHRFTTGSPAGERGTLLVTALTAAMMVFEIVAGHALHSVALVADGWHMGTHVVALGIAALAYACARRLAHDPRFGFGPGKIGPLGGYSSALILAGVAVLIVREAAQRLVHPEPIHFGEAIAVASLGLAVNVLSAVLLSGHHHGHGHGHGHDHHHGPGHDHDHDHDCHEHGQPVPPSRGEPHRDPEPGPVSSLHPAAPRTAAGHDLNLRAAYLHVLADAGTSAAAVTALCFGKFLGWVWLDPVVGLVGALVVGSWAYTLLRDTGRVLLDREVDPALAAAIRVAVEADGDSQVCDLHLLRVGLREFAAIVSVVAEEPRSPDEYKARLRSRPELAHVTVEVNRCQEHAPAVPAVPATGAAAWSHS